MYKPDVAFAISLTSRYQANPGESHWAAVKTILKYLKRTKEMFLVYGGEEELVVRGYADASFQTDRDDCRSQFGFMYVMNGGAVSWMSSKQDRSILLQKLNTLRLVKLQRKVFGSGIFWMILVFSQPR